MAKATSAKPSKTAAKPATKKVSANVSKASLKSTGKKEVKSAKPAQKSKSASTRLNKTGKMKAQEIVPSEMLKHNAEPETAKTGKAAASAVATAVPANKIQKILVRFTGVVRDVRRRVCPVGTATATYGDGNTVDVPISGGAHVPTYGITDAVTNKPMSRIEGRYYKNHKGQPMPYACFYNGGEALHIGRLDTISHGCVHVADWDKMIKLHNDSVKNKTLVTVRYAPGILDKVWSQTM